MLNILLKIIIIIVFISSDMNKINNLDKKYIIIIICFLSKLLIFIILPLFMSEKIIIPLKKYHTYHHIKSL